LKSSNANRTSNTGTANPVVQEEKACENCWITQAPLWRKSTSGGDLCNACGLYQYKRGFPRPVTRPENRPPCLDKPQTENPLQIPSPEHSSTEDQPTQAPDIPVPTSESSELVDVAGAIEMDVDQPIAGPIIRPNTPDSPPTLKRKRTPSIASVDSDVEAEDDDEDSDFQNFNYRISNESEYTVERCKELERIYWKTVTFNSPMYGADMPGSLFDDHTETWNVAKLDNLLCRIGKTIPGVNSAYLYLGMWKATFSWHVEVLSHIFFLTTGYGFVFHQLHSFWSSKTMVFH
jgi:GATA zinc finger